MTLDEFTSAAFAAGWSIDVIESFWEAAVRQNGHVILAHEAVFALRTGRGARQCTYRGETPSAIAMANEALDGVPLYIKPDDV